MNEKPGRAEDETTGSTGSDRGRRPPAEGKPQPDQPKRKPGDAARKMRQMFKGADRAGSSGRASERSSQS
ncbi:hypothetical protein ACFOY4_27105 [Actinomadura syzygii]|uniref:Uncharacterized protein n=1 Tax=Actinomadura syzygii TaxID=1427538 RepID=A0A5D0UFZ3_9ACTN|nr:hypothetical protein [Actinomadura syzygii]TYC17308.1 hypothetical protein FXF65_04620 [Actinomadura syzygii]